VTTKCTFFTNMLHFNIKNLLDWIYSLYFS
jgi:hypothetical protein